MFCFPQMGIISLFVRWADSSGSRRGLGVGGLRLQAAPSSLGSRHCLCDNLQQVGISTCAMEQAVEQFSSVM
jgi:hypothetical protein